MAIVLKPPTAPEGILLEGLSPADGSDIVDLSEFDEEVCTLPESPADLNDELRERRKLDNAQVQDEAKQPSPNQAEFDLPQVVARCVAGEREAVIEFVRHFESAVFAVCLRMLRDRQDAEDAAQETFLRAVRNLHRWDPARPLLPWLSTIAANRCRTALGKRSKRPKPAVSLPEQTVAAESDDVAEEVDRALALLPERYREVVIMHYRGGLNCAEIAEAMGCAEGTVKTWLFRARQQLADELSGRGFGPDPDS